MSEGDCRVMMGSMMEQFFSATGPTEKKEMFATRLSKTTEDIHR
jgi:hypothetical protein